MNTAISTDARVYLRSLAAPTVPTPAAAAKAPHACWNWLSAALDEVDYGMLLVASGAEVAHANQIARRELDDDHPLQLIGRRLQARYSQDAAPLHAALENAARRGLRQLLTMGTGDHRVGVSIVPLATVDSDGGAATLLILGKRQICEQLSVQGFARSHGLTSAEGRVLAALCAGSRPHDVATSLGVAISTVRTQIGSIRTKTGAESIGALLKQMAALPPLRGVLREGAWRASPSGKAEKTEASTSEWSTVL
ncbi:MAG: helix-turn-helix transcriptional regulator [Caldimonas sp.]